MRREAIASLLAFALAGCTAGSSRSESPGRPAKRDSAAEVNVGLGRAYMEQGKLDVAMEKLQKALSLDPQSVSAHTVIAVLYERIANEERAAYHYERAAQLGPKSGAAQNNYGTFLCRRGRYEEADQRFQRALEDPFYETPAMALANRGTCALQWGKNDVAEESLRRALQLEPNQPEALFQLAQILYDKKDYFRARAFVQRHEAAAGADPQALMLALRIELALDNPKGAREYRKRLLTEFPESEQAESLKPAEATQ